MKYEDFLELLKYRRSIRRFKPDPIPDEYVTKILDAARYSMSGANSQSWAFIVVKDPETRKKLFDVYTNHHDGDWYLEQMRAPEYRHPALNPPAEDKHKFLGWLDAPVVIAVLDDPRKHFARVQRAFQLPADQYIGLSMGHLSMVLHLAAASLGLGSQRVDMSMHQQPLREILGYPEPLLLNVLVPIGYRAYEPGPPQRWPLEEFIHFERYDMSKYLRDEDFLKYISRVRKSQAADWPKE